MNYTCSVCGDKVEGDLITFVDHTEDHIIEEIKKKHPEWVEEGGVCQRCVDYFREQLKGRREG